MLLCQTPCLAARTASSFSSAAHSVSSSCPTLSSSSGTPPDQIFDASVWSPQPYQTHACRRLYSLRGAIRDRLYADGMQIGTEQDTAKWKPTAAWNEATEEACRPHAKTALWLANAPRNAQERMQRQSMS